MQTGERIKTTSVCPLGRHGCIGMGIDEIDLDDTCIRHRDFLDQPFFLILDRLLVLASKSRDRKGKDPDE
jgi:hypothetical protein